MTITNLDILIARLQERLDQLGKSARQVSLEIGNNPDYVRNILRGHWPASNKLAAIAKKLNCSQEYLLGFTDNLEESISTTHLPVSPATLKMFILEALNYQGKLSPDEVAEVAAEAFFQHYLDGMTVEELRRVLQFRKPSSFSG